MSKIDCLFSLQSLLLNRFNTIVASGTNVSAAKSFHNLALTASNHSFDDGLYAQIKPFYEPVTGTFLSKVQALNASIEAGVSPSDFNAYIKLLTASLLAA
jgi:hypothetical protein